jgi:hypothetical protein
MPKIAIETGNGAHSTSSASMQAQFSGGPYAGQYLYTQKQYITGTQWDTSTQNERWCTTTYELPEGTEIVVKGKGKTGPRGVNIDEVHRRYRIDSSADVIEESLDVGLRRCLLKGRLVLIEDLIKKPAINTEDGF